MTVPDCESRQQPEAAQWDPRDWRSSDLRDARKAYETKQGRVKKAHTGDLITRPTTPIKHCPAFFLVSEH